MWMGKAPPSVDIQVGRKRTDKQAIFHDGEWREVLEVVRFSNNKWKEVKP